MKKSLVSLLLILCGLLFAQLRAQTAGDSCQYSIYLGAIDDTTSGYITDDRIDSWYAFNAIKPDITITSTSLTTGGNYDKMVLYSGACGSLVPIDSVFALSDTVMQMIKHFVPNGLYFIKVSQTFIPGCRTCVPDTITADLRIQQDGISPWCGFDPFQASRLAGNPGYSVQMTAQDQYIYNYITTHSSTAGPFTIPVVVHVLHYGEPYGQDENITYDQILWQIAAMNAAFQHDYANYNQQGYGHNYALSGPQDYSSNPQVRFCLAERGRDSALNVIPFFYNTMSGDTECGVMRYDLTLAPYNSIPNVDSIAEYNIANPIDEQALMDVTRPGTEFPNEMYLNIYLVPDICFGNCDGIPDPIPSVVGVGTMDASPFAGWDGIIFRPDVFGDNSVTGNSFNLYAPLQEGKIMDHEAGHYLSLYHTFQPDSAQPIGCWGMQAATAATQQCDRHGDYCCDTPPDAHQWVIPFAPVATMNTCTETYFTTPPGPDHRDMNENYMDYSDDAWYNTFTFDQSMRISAMLDVGGPRHSLVTPTNLALTGVSDTGQCHCCILVANIVPPGNTICVGTAMQFVTPTGNAFCANSWSWQFPGGTPSTSTLPNPVVTYNVAGTYTVILTASDGVNSVSDTAIINVVTSTVTISATNTIDTVCSQTHQHLELDFTGGIQPYSVSICDQNNIVVATVNNIFCDSAVILVPVSLASNQFFICSATNGLGCNLDTIIGNATFLVQECCANLFVNGDFEAVGTPGCNIAPSTSEILCSGYGTGSHNTYNPTTNFIGWPIVPPFDGQNGISMVIDCPTNPVHLTPIRHTVVWGQNVNLEQGVHYSLQFDYSSHYGNLGTTSLSPYLNAAVQLYLQFQVNGVFIGAPVNVEHCNMGEVWHTFTIDWINTFPTGIATVNICQVEAPPAFDVNFSGGGFDFLLDNISIRAMDIPIALAGSDTTICPTTFANIGSSLNDIDGSYLWLPNTFVACDTCFITTANPSNAIQYILQNQQRGCTVFDTVQVYILDVDAGNDTAFCGTGSVTLTANVTGNPSGHNTIWQPGGQTTDVIVVSPTVPTTYIVTVSDSLSTCTVSDTVIVYPSNVSVSVNSPKICSGDTALLTTSVTGSIGTISYLWNPTSQTTSSINVSPPASTSFTVIVTDSVGCADTAVAFVTVNSASVTASALPNPACIGSLIQLQATATGAGPFAYTWLPATNLSNSAIANPTIASYNGTTITYTVFISDFNGCEASDSVQLTVDPSCCFAPNYTLDTLFTNITGGNYAVNQDLYISGNVTIAGADMLIGSNLSIIVLSGSTLNITTQSHLHACYQMWQGIILRPGATVTVNGNSLIEDAYTAINCVSAPGASIQLTNAIFNKNQIAVLAQTWTGALNFNMINSRITCRQLPANPTVAMLTPGFLTGLPQSNLIAPLTSQRAFSGIQFLNGGNITIGALAGPATNIFDYLDHGIIGVNTNFIVRNNRFQNMLQPCSGPPSCSNNAGTAISANDPGLVVGNASTYNTVQIGGAVNAAANTFINCWRSVDITRYVNVTVKFNRINSTSTVISPPNLVNLNGDHGVFIRTTYAQVMDVNNNDIRNQARAIHINLSAGGLGYNTINVRDNHVSSAITATTFTTVGIQVDGISGVFFVTNNFLNIEGDTVLNANTCIQVRNIRNAVRVFSNGELKIRPNPTTTPGPNKTGIFVQNCEFVFIQDNLNIHSTGTALDSNNRNIRGIWVFNCAQSTVCNNWIRRVGQCLAFEGSCQFSTVRLDRFSDSYDGFVMRNNAIIGQQGNSTHPWDCRFLSGLTNHTYVYFSPNVNLNSRMFVRSTAPYFPTINTAPIPVQVYVPIPVGPIFIAAACGTTPPTFMNQQALRQAIAQNQVGYNSFPSETRVSNQKRLYKELNDNPILMLGDTILQNFYANNTPADLGFINSTESEVEQGNASIASSYNANIAGLSNSEWNQKVFNSIFLSTLMQGVDTLTSQQMSDLFTIAEQCPNQGGDAVWQSRAMIDWMTHSANDFADSCAAENARLIGPDSTTQIQSSVYPNPNAGSVTVKYELHETSNATFEVLDLAGRVISVTKLDSKQSQQIIDLTELANGPYIYKIIGDGDLVDTGTLIISK